MKTTDDFLEEINKMTLTEMMRLLHALEIWGRQFWCFGNSSKPFINAIIRAKREIGNGE